jgi:N-methylhydantoinase A
MSAFSVARGLIEVVESTMDRAIRTVSVEEGSDPSRSTLIGFGGAGGLHAVALARRLGMRSVIVPPYAGVFSALGLLLAPVRLDQAETVLSHDLDVVRAAFGRLTESIGSDFEEMVGRYAGEVTLIADMRYVGQSHETSVPFEPGDTWVDLVERFHRVHQEFNGFARVDDPVEVATVRAEAIGEPALRWTELPGHRPVGPELLGQREVWVDGGDVSVPVWSRSGLGPGRELFGPCVVVDDESTTWLDQGDRAVLHDSGALEVTW